MKLKDTLIHNIDLLRGKVLHVVAILLRETP